MKTKNLLLARLLDEYAQKLRASIKEANSIHEPPKIRQWINNNPLSGGFHLMSPTESDPPEQWKWIDDPGFIHESLSGITEVTEKIEKLAEDLMELTSEE